ncbi:MAG: 4-hydroxy-3-methylbut-2-enyl diphosphate reductase [Firmicutes bacterium]|nr:4-hydroxy-3-methylbut-2-enyl diphosphate reductase [Bacillota bacterium]
MTVKRIVLAEPRGFCAGVEMAIKALSWMVRIFEPPVYCYHEIVHNRLIVEEFERQGVIFVNDVSEVPPYAPVMLSAHGSAPEVEQQASADHKVAVNAVCPLVTKVHHELKIRAQQGYTIIYIGHQGHEEAIGTMAVAPESVRLVEHENDLDELGDITSPVALLAQTTLPHDEWKGIAEGAKTMFPDIWTPGKSDLCYATTNRQAALKTIVDECDTVIVIGSANSSNTVSLAHVAEAAGCKRVLRIDSASQLPDDLAGTVGITAGASAPEWLVEEVIAALNPTDGVAKVKSTDEDEYFPPPRDLRELISAMTAALQITIPTKNMPDSPIADDKNLSAVEMLLQGHNL